MRPTKLISRTKPVLLMAAILMVALNSCRIWDDHDSTDTDYIPDDNSITEVSSYPVALIGAIPSNIEQALRIHFTNISSAVTPATRVVFFHMDGIGTVDLEAIKEVYDDDGIVVVLDPDYDVLASWAERQELHYAMSVPEENGSNSGDSNGLYAFNKNDNHFFLDYLPEDLTHYTSLNSLANWVDQYAPGRKFGSGYSPNDVRALFDCQTIDHTYSLYLKVTEAKVALSKADIIERSGHIDVKMVIYPLYSFQDQQTHGDFYLVSTTVTAHNNEMYQGNWIQKHGTIQSNLCGFYMEKLEVKTEILTNGGSAPQNATFAAKGTPQPVVVAGQTSYNHGFSWDIGASVSGSVNAKGPNVGMTVNGGVSFTESKTENIFDVEITNRWTGSTTVFAYDFKNLPDPKANERISNPPNIATNNAEFYQDWIWQVESTKDNGQEVFMIKNTIAPVYGSCHVIIPNFNNPTKHHWNDAIKGPDSYFTYTLTPPNRTPTGKLQINNTMADGIYVTDIKIWGKSPLSAAPDYTVEGSFAKGHDPMITNLPTGTYKILLKAGRDAGSLVTYHSNEIVIKRGETNTLNSGFDFTKGGF